MMNSNKISEPIIIGIDENETPRSKNLKIAIDDASNFEFDRS